MLGNTPYDHHHSNHKFLEKLGGTNCGSCDVIFVSPSFPRIRCIRIQQNRMSNTLAAEGDRWA